MGLSHAPHFKGLRGRLLTEDPSDCPILLCNHEASGISHLGLAEALHDRTLSISPSLLHQLKDHAICTAVNCMPLTPA